MNDGNYSNQNMIIEDKIVDNCIFSYSNEKIISKQCSSIYGSFPYFHSYTSYQSAAANQESEFMQLIKYKIEKKGDQIFEKYYSEAQKPEDKDKYILKSTLYLNEHNLISKLISGKDLIKVEYIYYP
jgi:ATP-dependent exoDNAse (exonuclease V) alpha subunit